MAYRLVLLIQSWAQPCCCSVSKHVTPRAVAPPGSGVHGISRARILEWAAISFSRGSFWPKDGTCVSYIGRQILYHWATKEVHTPHFMHFNLTFILSSQSSCFPYIHVGMKWSLKLHVEHIIISKQLLHGMCSKQKYFSECSWSKAPRV